MTQPFRKTHRGSLQSVDRTNGRFGRELTGDLTGFVTAHPIGDQIQSKVGHDRVAIFVRLSAHPHVGAGC